MIDSVYSSRRRLGWNELWLGNENLAKFRQARGGSPLMGYRLYRRDVFSLLLYMTCIIDARMENGRWMEFFYTFRFTFRKKKRYLLNCNYTDIYRSKIILPWIKFLRFLSLIPSSSPPENKKGRWPLNVASNLPDERTGRETCLPASPWKTINYVKQR